MSAHAAKDLAEVIKRARKTKSGTAGKRTKKAKETATVKPGRRGKGTGVPHGAQAELLEEILRCGECPQKEMMAVMKRWDVRGDPEKLQEEYQRKEGQRFLASVRDDKGRRLILCTKGGSYVMVDYCRDMNTLRSIYQRLESQMTGLTKSENKVLDRVEALKALSAHAASENGADPEETK